MSGSVDHGVLQKELFIEGFRRWLEMMNYIESSIKYDPVRLSEFLEWCEVQKCSSMAEITGEKVKQFFEYLEQRKNKRTGAVLSVATMRIYITTLNRFGRYLRQSEKGNLEVPVSFKGQSKKSIVVLTEAEIGKLYEICDDSLLGIRDRAMLAVFYGCGVRRNEAVNIEIKDIIPDKNLLYIRKGKGHKERYIPIVGQVRNDILNYITTARPMMTTRESKEELFIGITGSSLSGASLYNRLKRLLKRSGIEKDAGLHTLRHSIATHLLSNGMKLSEIAKFLGHSSMESTQIYTHLQDEL